MTLGCALLNGRQMVLPIFTVHALVAAGGVEFTDAPAVEEELAALQVTLLECKFIQSYQGHLHYSMTRGHFYAILIEDT